LLMAVCIGTRGWISGGADVVLEAENREPPSKDFLLEERDLSSSVRVSILDRYS